MLSLVYTSVDGIDESLFTLNERETALAIARDLSKRGLRPRLVQRTHNDPCVKVLFDWRSNVVKKPQRRAA